MPTLPAKASAKAVAAVSKTRPPQANLGASRQGTPPAMGKSVPGTNLRQRGTPQEQLRRMAANKLSRK